MGLVRKPFPLDPGVETDSPGWQSLRAKRRTPALFRLLGGVEEGAEFVDVLGEHAGELDAVADLRVGGDDRGEHEESAINLQLELETRADGEWEDRFNVASPEAEVGRGAADGRVAPFGEELDRDSYFEARVLSAVGVQGAC